MLTMVGWINPRAESVGGQGRWGRDSGRTSLEGVQAQRCLQDQFGEIGRAGRQPEAQQKGSWKQMREQGDSDQELAVAAVPVGPYKGLGSIVRWCLEDPD